MKCGKPYCVCVGQCFAQQSQLNDTSGGSMTTEAERLASELVNPSGLSFPRTQAANMLRQQAAELTRLHDYDTRLSAVMPADYKDWHEGSKREWPELAAESIKMWRGRANEAYAEIESLKAQVEALSPRRNVSPPADTLILHKMRYHYWEADGDDPADFELFDAGVECDTCIDVYIVRADKLDAQTALLRHAYAVIEEAVELIGSDECTAKETLSAIKQHLGDV